MKYLGNRSLAAALTALAIFTTIGACTEIDDRLGAGLVPKNQQMQIEIAAPSGEGVRTLLYKRDSIPSSRTGYAWLGQTTDAAGVFGRRTASAVLQFLPSSWGYNYEGYGLDPIVDSAVIFTALAGVRGDTTLVQRFDVWDITGAQERLRRDTTYYANFPIDKYRGRKLFEFTHKGRRGVSSRLVPTAEGRKYLDSIVRIKWEDYLDDSLFHRKFQGLYITPAEGSPAAAAIYGNDLASSGLMLYVRNHDTIDRTAIYDTMVTAFSFRDTDQAATSSSGSVAWSNVSVGMSAFDYTGSTLGGLQARTNNFTDTLPTSAPLSTVYVQSGGGVGTYLRFTDEMIAQLRGLRTSAGMDGKDLAIDRASLRIWLDTAPGETVPSTATMDASNSRLGSYLRMQSLATIPDYQYVYEAYKRSQQGSSGWTLPYGGYLNRSNGYYEFDITSYIQQLMKIKEGDDKYLYTHPAFYLAPDIYNIFGTGQTILKGTGSDHPVSVKVTYTIIEG